jgi:hypothetical protein
MPKSPPDRKVRGFLFSINWGLVSAFNTFAAYHLINFQHDKRTTQRVEGQSNGLEEVSLTTIVR